MCRTTLEQFRCGHYVARYMELCKRLAEHEVFAPHTPWPTKMHESTYADFIQTHNHCYFCVRGIEGKKRAPNVYEPEVDRPTQEVWNKEAREWLRHPPQCDHPIGTEQARREEAARREDRAWQEEQARRSNQQVLQQAFQESVNRVPVPPRFGSMQQGMQALYQAPGLHMAGSGSAYQPQGIPYPAGSTMAGINPYSTMSQGPPAPPSGIGSQGYGGSQIGQGSQRMPGPAGQHFPAKSNYARGVTPPASRDQGSQQHTVGTANNPWPSEVLEIDDEGWKLNKYMREPHEFYVPCGPNGEKGAVKRRWRIDFGDAEAVKKANYRRARMI